MFFLDPTYLIFMLPAFILMMIVSAYVKSAYNKWSRIQASSRLTGSQTAQHLASSLGLYHLRIENIPGHLTDHYDPRKKVLRLSDDVYQSNSVAAVAIAAHEMGHAMQDQEDYFPFRLRGALVPAVSLGSYLGWILIIIGILLKMTDLAWVGVVVFSGGALFALTTLPVELNASARAKRLLLNAGVIYSPEEQKGVNHVLNAAALTYVAALITAVMQLLYYVFMVFGMGRRDD